MITQLSSKANTSELNGTASNFSSIIEKSASTDPTLLKLNTSLKTSNDALTRAVDKKLGSDKTDLIWEFEGLRDDSLKSFFLTIQGCTLRQNKIINEAGSLIWEAITRHGKTMYNLPHVQQTAKMDSLFKDLELPAMVAALQTTQTGVIVDETKKANQDFLNALNERTDETATKEEIGLVSAARKPVKIAMEKIMNYLNSIIPMAEHSELGVVYTSLNQVVADANATIKARITTKENKKKENGTKK